MKNKDTILLEEAYEKVLEANFMQNAVNTGRYAVNSLIDKGKNVLGIKAPERGFGQSWAKWAEDMGIEPPPFLKIGASYNEAARAAARAAWDAWEKKYPAAAAYINKVSKQKEEEEAFRKSPQGRQKEIDDYSRGIANNYLRAGLTADGMQRQ